MTDTPNSLRRPGRRDPLLATVEVLTRGYAAMSGRSKAQPVTEVDRTLHLLVHDRRAVARDAVQVELRAVDGGPLPAWSPGAHLDLVLEGHPMRQYSLCGNPTDHDRYLIAVRRLPGGRVSTAINDHLEVGQRVTVKGPRNAFPFAYPHLARADIRSILFIAGGIGITAIKPMIYAAATNHIDWQLRYVGRDEHAMPFLDDLRALGEHRTHIHHRRPPVEELLAHASPTTSVYLCGPPTMLTEIRDLVDRRTTAGFHFERFSPPPIINGRPFNLHLARSDTRVSVGPTTSALSAVRAHRPDVSYSCQQGFCGTCRVRVLHGSVERRGSSPFLAADDTMLTCVDRAKSALLTIDL